ncbi:MAG: crossover junction endodeoxyribonuclease RuvC, partial [Lentisphaeria bacterium]|nr:crossover junction endodeoxyribonuclease RuvC [Lentisphaeria bacterium]
DPFLGRNAKTAIILGMARVAILSAIAEQRIPCCAYSPKSAKRAAVGNGSAEKGQVAVMIAAMFNIGIDRIPLDATDALALALCHAQILAAGQEIAAAKIKTL